MNADCDDLCIAMKNHATKRLCFFVLRILEGFPNDHCQTKFNFGKNFEHVLIFIEFDLHSKTSFLMMPFVYVFALNDGIRFWPKLSQGP